MIPPLVTFLPGALITSGILDLVVGHLISGASRLVGGTLQLVLLTLGIAIGAALAGVSPDAATANAPLNTLGAWAPWLGAVVFGLGCYMHFFGPPHSLGWLLLVLLAAWAGERLGAGLLSGELGPFVGAFIMTPLAAWIERRRAGPPALATLMPAYWLLVPGVLGLIGVGRLVGANYPAALGEMVTALISFVLIGVGVFAGYALVQRMQPVRTGSWARERT